MVRNRKTKFSIFNSNQIIELLEQNEGYEHSQIFYKKEDAIRLRNLITAYCTTHTLVAKYSINIIPSIFNETVVYFTLISKRVSSDEV